MTDASRPPGMSVRIKLTLSYAAFLVVAGIALFVVGFLVLRFVPNGALFVADGRWAPNRSDLIEVFVRYAWWALAALVIFGLAGGWILAGVVLRPLQRIADAARRVRDGRLDSRVALPGPRNELTDLADALDAMLDRVEHTIDEERRFAANASHELRTPHAIVRTMVEVAQADPDGRDIDVLLQRIATTNDRAIATTEALLTLARVGRDVALETETLDVGELAEAALQEAKTDAEARGIRISASLPTTLVRGNRALLAQLVANLVQNAIIHNEVGGWIRMTLATRPRAAELVIDNSGPVLDADTVSTFTEPFVRGGGRARAANEHQGAGLGLAIVASIVRAHAGSLEVLPLDDGGLHVRVTLPR